jgi:hypothetical protein
MPRPKLEPEIKRKHILDYANKYREQNRESVNKKCLNYYYQKKSSILLRKKIKYLRQVLDNAKDKNDVIIQLKLKMLEELTKQLNNLENEKNNNTI